MTRTPAHLSPEVLARIDTIVGPQGRSKFIRQAVGQLLDGLAPMTDNTDPPYLEYDGGHEPRLTGAGTAVLLNVIRRYGFDDLQHHLGFTDSTDFLYTLLGHRRLPDRVVSILTAEAMKDVRSRRLSARALDSCRRHSSQICKGPT